MLTLDKPLSKRKAKIRKNQILNETLGEEPNSLWNNPAVNEMKLKLSKEQQEEYKRKGEAMYGDMDFENLDKKIYTATEYVQEYLKAGLHPSSLTDDEKAVMESRYGKNWPERFGYTQNDIIPTKQ